MDNSLFFKTHLEYVTEKAMKQPSSFVGSCQIPEILNIQDEKS